MYTKTRTVVNAKSATLAWFGVGGEMAPTRQGCGAGDNASVPRATDPQRSLGGTEK